MYQLLYFNTNYTSYINIIIFVACAFVFGLLLYGLNFMLYSLKEERYKNRHTFKVYEFGTTTIGSLQTVSSTHFFILSILFIIFDVELLYLYFWITAINPLSSLIYKILFLLMVNIVIVGLFYEIINGMLVWYKTKKLL